MKRIKRKDQEIIEIIVTQEAEIEEEIGIDRQADIQEEVIEVGIIIVQGEIITVEEIRMVGIEIGLEIVEGGMIVDKSREEDHRHQTLAMVLNIKGNIESQSQILQRAVIVQRIQDELIKVSHYN